MACRNAIMEILRKSIEGDQTAQDFAVEIALNGHLCAFHMPGAVLKTLINVIMLSPY